MADELKRIVETAGRAVAGAVGTAAGMAAGAAAALAAGGKPKPREVNAQNEELYWREHFAAESYYDPSQPFEHYLPAWRTGWEGRGKYAGRSFQDAERELESDYYWNRGKSPLTWEQAKPAVQAGWDHA